MGGGRRRSFFLFFFGGVFFLAVWGGFWGVLGCFWGVFFLAVWGVLGCFRVFLGCFFWFGFKKEVAVFRFSLVGKMREHIVLFKFFFFF